MTSNGNGSAKWQIAFWLLTVLTIASFSWTTFCAWDNRCQIQRNMERYITLKDVANDALHSIDLRLSRIEDKIMNVQ